MRSNRSKEPKTAEIAALAASLVQQGKDPETATAEALRIWDASQKALIDRAMEPVLAAEFENLKTLGVALPVTEQSFEGWLREYLGVYNGIGKPVTFDEVLKMALPGLKASERLPRLKRILAHRQRIKPIESSDLIRDLRARAWYGGQSERFASLLRDWDKIRVSDVRRQARLAKKIC